MLLNIEGADALLATYKTLLDDGALYVVAGAKPTDASSGLDLANTHTILGVVTKNAGALDSGDGLAWDTPLAGVLNKPVGDTWSSDVPAFVGVDDSETTLVASFALWVGRTVDPEDAAAPGEMRIVFDVLGYGGAYDLILANGTSIEAGGSPIVVTFAQIMQPL